MKNILIQDLKAGKKLQIVTTQLNFLKNLSNRGLTTPEIAKLARRVIGGKNQRRIKAEQKRQLALRIQETTRDLNRVR